MLEILLFTGATLLFAGMLANIYYLTSSRSALVFSVLIDLFLIVVMVLAALAL
jgi:hypothetical protein